MQPETDKEDKYFNINNKFLIPITEKMFLFQSQIKSNHKGKFEPAKQKTT